MEERLRERARNLVPVMFGPAAIVQLALLGLILYMSRETLRLNLSRVEAEHKTRAEV